MANLVSRFIDRLRTFRVKPPQAVGSEVEDWLESERVGKDYWIQRIMQEMHDPAFSARFQKIATQQLPNTGAFNRLLQAVAAQVFQRDYENLTEDEQLQVFHAAAQRNPALYAAMQQEWAGL